MTSRCYLCLGKTKFNDALVCTVCFCRVQDYQWLSCSRCGDSNCSGCSELIEFNSVTCLYSYKDILANILVMSKENNSIWAQKVFHELFFVAAKNTIVNAILLNNYTHIIVSPLRKDRIFYGAWHTNIFYDEVLQYIFTHNMTQEKKPQILFPHYSKYKKKQSLIPFYKRYEQRKMNLELIFHEKISVVKEPSKILLLDDVLTTGETSMLCKSLCADKFSNATWDLFTLLRAPKSVSATD